MSIHALAFSFLSLSYFAHVFFSADVRADSFQRYFSREVFEFVLEVGEPFRLDPEQLVSEWGKQQGRFFWLPPRLPSWLKHVSFNELSGTPGHPDMGIFEASLSLGRAGSLRDTTILRFQVVKRVPPPTGSTSPPFPNPIELPLLILEKPFLHDLRQIPGFREKKVCFEKRSGPPWLEVSSDGILRGTPRGGPGYFQATIFVTFPGATRRTLSIFGGLIL